MSRKWPGAPSGARDYEVDDVDFTPAEKAAMEAARQRRVAANHRREAAENAANARLAKPALTRERLVAFARFGLSRADLARHFQVAESEISALGF